VVLVATVSSFVYAGSVSAHGDGSYGATGPTYNVTFSETGLAAGTPWGVALLGHGPFGLGHFGHHRGPFGSNTSSFNVSLPNGSYRYLVLPVAGYSVSSGAYGTVNVSGAPTSVSVAFSKLPTYTVTFQEVGLPAGTNWSVRVAGGAFLGFWGGDGGRMSNTSDTPTITFSLTNGTYYYGAHARGFRADSGGSGMFRVSGASPATISVTFLPLPTITTYNVTFTETGLPAGTNWTVGVVGTSGGGLHGPTHAIETTSTGSMTFALRNGSYRYFVAEVPGYEVADNGSFGSFAVAGASPASIAISFVRLVNYTVTFSEAGLPSGTNWSVLVVGRSAGGALTYEANTSSTPTITFSVSNGTYEYRVLHVDGYSAGNTTFGVFNVSGAAPAAIAITFAAESGWGGVPAVAVAATASV
jgi:hypothetical protein